MQETSAPAATSETPVNPKTKWYRDHKTPELRERMNATRRAYYARNQELERKRSSDRYYAKKAILAAQKAKQEAEMEALKAALAAAQAAVANPPAPQN